jgi:hypothetical protein
MGNSLSSLYRRRFITFRFTENRRHPTDYDSNNRSLGLFHRQKPHREKEAKHAHDTSRRVAASSDCRPPRRTRSVFFVFIARGAISPRTNSHPPTSRLRFPKGAARRGEATRLCVIAKPRQFSCVSCHASTRALPFLSACRFSFSLDVSQTESHSIGRRFLVSFRGSPPLLVGVVLRTHHPLTNDCWHDQHG